MNSADVNMIMYILNVPLYSFCSGFSKCYYTFLSIKRHQKEKIHNLSEIHVQCIKMLLCCSIPLIYLTREPLHGSILLGSKLCSQLKPDIRTRWQNFYLDQNLQSKKAISNSSKCKWKQNLSPCKPPSGGWGKVQAITNHLRNSPYKNEITAPEFYEKPYAGQMQGETAVRSAWSRVGTKQVWTNVPFNSLKKGRGSSLCKWTSTPII